MLTVELKFDRDLWLFIHLLKWHHQKIIHLSFFLKYKMKYPVNIITWMDCIRRLRSIEECRRDFYAHLTSIKFNLIKTSILGFDFDFDFQKLLKIIFELSTVYWGYLSGLAHFRSVQYHVFLKNCLFLRGFNKKPPLTSKYVTSQIFKISLASIGKICWRET